MKILLEPYTRTWEKWFHEEKVLLHRQLKRPNLMLVHIGSTAVNGLVSRPVIDMMLHQAVPFQQDKLHKELDSLGYQQKNQPHAKPDVCRFFIKTDKRKRIFHLYLTIAGSNFWKRHLIFRNYLRNHKPARIKYAKLKLELSRKDWKSISDYHQSKTLLIRELEKEAVLWNTLNH